MYMKVENQKIQHDVVDELKSTVSYGLFWRNSLAHPMYYEMWNQHMVKELEFTGACKKTCMAEKHQEYNLDHYSALPGTWDPNARCLMVSEI